MRGGAAAAQAATLVGAVAAGKKVRLEKERKEDEEKKGKGSTGTATVKEIGRVCCRRGSASEYRSSPGCGRRPQAPPQRAQEEGNKRRV